MIARVRDIPIGSFVMDEYGAKIPFTPIMKRNFIHDVVSSIYRKEFYETSIAGHGRYYYHKSWIEINEPSSKPLSINEDGSINN
jgi:hypothetical protein